MSEEPAQTSLKRTLGLPAAMSVGLGTMLGAGIFVFPGLAANEAGPAAILSFAIGGVIALLVALCTAELATAMPRSGGAYFYISRSFGPFAGFLVGIGQTVGLIFASGFYLVAFADYLLSLFASIGIPAPSSTAFITIVAALLLTAINLVGSREAGRIQSAIVLMLLILLCVLFGYALLRVTGLTGEPYSLPKFAPFGIEPVFTTAAFVFTAYLGFVQIATVAGEVQKPGRTLPIALVGSVLIVVALYVIALFVTTALLPTERLAESGSKATISLGQLLFGEAGKFLVLVAGLLATLSSANASILSSSRTLFALGNDQHTPAWTAKVNARLGVPLFAIIAVGVAVATLTFVSELKTLAEVASALHLLIYGLICLALLQQRRAGSPDYRPLFRVPLAGLTASVGAISCLGLLYFMETATLAIAAGVMLAAAVWYSAYGRDRVVPDSSRNPTDEQS